MAPAIGGFLLAFPGIFPASATLVEEHEMQKKKRVGLQGISRERQAAVLDAAGVMLGCMAWAASHWSPGLC
jgi:hypothetical protein